jgi:hypothetical protein
MKTLLPIPNVENARAVGQRLWFEYHCWESHESADAELWYHSHQECVVLGLVDCDGQDIYSQEERYYGACTLTYRVRFDDGQEFDAVEDELLDSRDEFTRVDPPLGP